MKVIPHYRLPTKFPLLSTTVLWMLLERHPVGPRWDGVIWTFVIFYWIACIVAVFREKSTDLKELK